MHERTDLFYGLPLQFSRFDTISHTQTYAEADCDAENGAADGSIAESDFTAVDKAYDAKANGPR